MRSTLQRLFVIGSVAFLAGCKQPPAEPPITQKPDYTRELGPGEVALRKMDPSQYPDFSEGFNHQTNLEQAALYSLEYLHKASAKKTFPYLDITHERAVASVEAFIEVLHTAKSGAEFDQMIKEKFEVYESRGYNDQGIVLFTGYYRPIFDARLKPDAEFKFPLYRRPPDLAQDPTTLANSRQGGGAYLTRADIEHGALAGKGLELCYLRDRFEAYIVTVQGSGRLRLQDNSFFDIGYSGDNGHPYTSVGQALVQNNLIQREDLSLQGLIKFFKENPEQLDQALAVNNRYVFFTPRSGGPFGSLNVPVSPYRTIATDKQVYPRASAAFLMTQLPARGADGRISNYTYSAFAFDQDTGGAIRAAGRCDVFLGTGPEVGELAGRTFAEGRLYYIFVKTGEPRSAALASPAPEPQPAPPPNP